MSSNIDVSEKGRSWRIIDIFVVLSAYFVVMIIFYVLLGKTIGSSIFDEQNLPPWLYFIEGLVESTVIATLPILFVAKAYLADIREIGVTSVLPKNGLWAGLILGVFLWLAISGIDLAMEYFLGPGPTHPDILRIQSSSGPIGYMLVVTPALLLSPIAEEIYVRGFVYTIFKKRFGVPVAIILSSVFFASLHLKFWWIPHTLFVGVTLAILRERYGSVVPGIFAHSTINLLSIL